MAVLLNNNKKVDFNAIKKKLINKVTGLYVTMLLSTFFWLSVVTSESIVLIVSPSLLQRNCSFWNKNVLIATNYF